MHRDGHPLARHAEEPFPFFLDLGKSRQTHAFAREIHALLISDLGHGPHSVVGTGGSAIGLSATDA
jgi:hypothetical protein